MAAAGWHLEAVRPYGEAPPGEASVNEKTNRQFNNQMRRLERAGAAGRVFAWLSRPGVRLVRLPLAVLLIIGGMLAFLPVLGFWMLPLGLLLAAVDIPLLRGPVTRLVAWLRRSWRRWRRRGRNGEGQ